MRNNQAKSKRGVLLVNLGTPDEPTAKAVSRFLREFLSDPRVIDLPALPWRLFLNTVVLPIRSPRVAKKYHEIWGEEDSPLRTSTRQIAKKLTERLSIPVKVGMRYGNPSIVQALLELRQERVEHLVVLPLFPQYSSSTTASVFDAVTRAFKNCPALPHFKFIGDYHTNEGYIQALAEKVKSHWASNGRSQKLLITFHGLPKRYVKKGDVYEKQCQTTAALLAEALVLQTSDWELCYQSRFGKAQWLQPYTASVLTALPAQGIKSVDVISPGFPADCLETLEELCIQYRVLFEEAGGQVYRYIPALNEDDMHIDFLADLIRI
ncbi:MAG: ferrochelatase [Legionellales bacterium]|nr:ferrochelatase [Legionellales bacterium]